MCYHERVNDIAALQEYLPGTSAPGLMEFRVQRIQQEMRDRDLPDDLEELVMNVSIRVSTSARICSCFYVQLLRMDPAERCKYPSIAAESIFYYTCVFPYAHIYGGYSF